MSELYHRTQAAELEKSALWHRSVLRDCFRQKIPARDAAVQLNLREQEVTNWYLRFALQDVSAALSDVLNSDNAA